MISQATYIWIDGTAPTKRLRSKTRMLRLSKGEAQLSDFPDWGFDGSSTQQAQGYDSDLILKACAFHPDPLTGQGNYLVLCEVYSDESTPHPSNTRATLRHQMESCRKTQDPWIGFEQEYTLFQGLTPLGWPEGGYPAPQGPFYCGVGADEAFGRDFVQDHTDACLFAGLMLFGTNAEVMPGQWEFQVGYRDIDSESADPLTVSDHLWIARWLLYRIGEEYGITATLEPKPVKGSWNGAGKHTNFSTKAMRDKNTGWQTIESAIHRLDNNHHKHIPLYGAGLDERLVGDCETSDINTFSAGVGDRNASIRIPKAVKAKGYGYIEDRRPGANADPYEVSSILVETICEVPQNTNHIAKETV
ncbi:MAG TPA: glutamine synthetase [Coxiellaceae bacterium]|nr:glutamine synthetase [Coxiellaceae bacterium]